MTRQFEDAMAAVRKEIRRQKELLPDRREGLDDDLHFQPDWNGDTGTADLEAIVRAALGTVIQK